MFSKAVKTVKGSSVSFKSLRTVNEIAIKNRESVRFVEESIVDNWMDMG
jgi:hypothetical protein